MVVEPPTMDEDEERTAELPSLSMWNGEEVCCLDLSLSRVMVKP